MATFAVIKNGLVVNTILADSQEIAEQCNPECICIEYTQENPVSINWTYDGVSFTQPAEDQPIE
jgi:hypothetical protein